VGGDRSFGSSAYKKWDNGERALYLAWRMSKKRVYPVNNNGEFAVTVSCGFRWSLWGASWLERGSRCLWRPRRCNNTAPPTANTIRFFRRPSRLILGYRMIPPTGSLMLARESFFSSFLINRHLLISFWCALFSFFFFSSGFLGYEKKRT
jgi:hypothetical protein